MDSKQAAELSSRVVASESLAPADEQRLLDHFAERTKWRDELLDNEEVETTLRCMSRCKDTEESFLAATMERIARGDSPPPVAPISGVEPQRAPTVTVCQPRPTRPPTSRREKVIALCATVVLTISLGWLVLFAISSRSNRIVESKQGDPATNAPYVEDGFAYIVDTDKGVWDSPMANGDRLGVGTFKLLSGESIIRFDNGTEATLKGPLTVDLRSTSEVRLNRGKIAVTVPKRAIGFTVETPVGDVVDLGTVFEVSVEPSGLTEAVVRVGRIRFKPQRPGGVPGKAIELTPSGLNRVISSIPDTSDPSLPVSTVATGKQGQFVGAIDVGGKTLEFDSPENLESYLSGLSPPSESRPGMVEEDRGEAPDSSTQSHATSSSSASSGGVAIAGGSETRSISVSENGKTVSISETSEAGIEVTITERIEGKERQTVVRARTPEELKEKDPRAFDYYQRYLGGSK